MFKRGTEAPMDFEYLKPAHSAAVSASEATAMANGANASTAITKPALLDIVADKCRKATSPPTSPTSPLSQNRSTMFRFGGTDLERTPSTSSSVHQRDSPALRGSDDANASDDDDDDVRKTLLKKWEGGNGFGFGLGLSSPPRTSSSHAVTIGLKRKKANAGDWVPSTKANIHHHVYHHGWSPAPVSPPVTPLSPVVYNAEEENDYANGETPQMSPEVLQKTNESTSRRRSSQRSVSHLAMPYLIGSYVQLLFSIVMVAVTIYIVIHLVLTVRHDLKMKVDENVLEITAQIAECSKQYVLNTCAPETRAPALDKTCREWEVCMIRDPREVGRLKVGAETIAEILNKLVDPLSYKTMIFGSVLLFGTLISTSNLLALVFGRSESHHGNTPLPLPKQQHHASSPLPLQPLPSPPAPFGFHSAPAMYHHTPYSPPPYTTVMSQGQQQQWSPRLLEAKATKGRRFLWLQERKFCCAYSAKQFPIDPSSVRCIERVEKFSAFA
ncbi:Di-sulfide bridge nucleocytoplasmic transport domain-containing protein [Cladochytrium replicatum]|nr:Di-sulfide bridge nucleocytoplasmic transport domain-containing protein [Cladochytrium replicatum]